VKKILFVILLFIAPFILYWHTVDYGLTYLDDDALVGNSAVVKRPLWLRDVFAKDVFLGDGFKSGFYRPLLNLSFIADGLIGGGKLWFFHISNIFLHSCFCVLLFFFLSQFGIASRAAFAGALFFCVMPYSATAVAWLPGRNDILLALFITAAAMCVAKWRGSGRSAYLAASSFFFCSALFIKETAAVFPAVALFIIYMRGGFRRKYISEFLLSALLPVFIYSLARSRADLAGALGSVSLGHIFLFPSLTVGYFTHVFELSPQNIIMSCFVFLSFTFFFLYTGRKNVRNVAFGLVWFVVFLIPPLMGRDMFEGYFYVTHRLYLPMAGLVFSVCSVISYRRTEAGKSFARCAAAVFLAFLCAETYLYSVPFRDRLSFVQQRFSAGIKKDYGAHYAFLGDYYFDRRQYRLAGIYYIKALARGFETGDIHLHMAAVYMTRGDIEGMRRELSAELRVSPGDRYAADGLAQLESAGYIRDGGKK